VLQLVIIFIALLLCEILYFKIADKFNIIDRPNHRSSHNIVTIRGGGIIFILATLTFYLFYGFNYSFFTFGVVLIGAISFLDDLVTLNNKVRLVVHLLSVLLLVAELGFFSAPILLVIAVVVFAIGTINAYNFMDGINGMTGAYSFAVVATLYYVNKSNIPFASPALFNAILISLLVFNIFNFRKKAKCFAGDVGSVSIAFIIVFLLGRLMFETNNYAYILFLVVYGLDAVSTIFFRILRRENIFEAHRSHFYQFLTNERKIPHLLVSSGYAVCQLLINIFIISCSENIAAITSFTILLTTVFIGARLKLEGVKRLIYTSH